MQKSVFIRIKGLIKNFYVGLRKYISFSRRERIVNSHKGTRSGYYDRNLAKIYAETYAESANTKEYPYYKEADCANFVSQALKAGGLKEEGIRWDKDSSWFCRTNKPSELTKVSLSWRSARYFRQYFGNENGIGRNRAASFRKITVENALKSFDDIYDSLDIGDVVQYGDPKKNDIPYHTQIVCVKGFNTTLNKRDLLVCQHSAERKNISLYKYLDAFKDKEIRYVYLYKIGDN